MMIQFKAAFHVFFSLPPLSHHRVVVKISCRMDFDNYPFDKHICRFRVGSCKGEKKNHIFKDLSARL